MKRFLSFAFLLLSFSVASAQGGGCQANAGGAAAACGNSIYNLLYQNATSSGGTASWSSTGNGWFQYLTGSGPYTDLSPLYHVGSTDLSSGSVTLTLTVSGANGCMATSSFVLTLVAPPVAVIDPSVVNPWDELHVFAGGSYNFSNAVVSPPGADIHWDGGDGSFNSDNIQNPIYTPGPQDISNGNVYIHLNVISFDGTLLCDNMVDINLVIDPAPAPAMSISSQTNVSCFGGSNGAASINTPTGGAGGYTYNWTPGNPTGDGTVSVTGLTAGTWTCTVTDANSATATQSFTVTEPTAISVTPSSQTNVSCFGGSNGAASINTPTGGAGAYTYNWTPGNPTGDGTVSVTGLTAGTWTCTVTDANSCTATQSFTVTEPTTIPAQPTLACYESANFNTSTCSWDVTGTQPAFTGNAVNINVTITGPCAGIGLSGTYINSGLLNGYYDFQRNHQNGFTYHISYSGTQWVLWVADFNNNGFMSSSSASNGLYPPTTGWTPTQCANGSLSWSLASPLLACYQTANFNTTTCTWDVTGTPPAAPTGNASQTFCSTVNATIASIQVTGTGIQWYASNTGGSVLATTTPLVTGTTYYATQTISGCESPSYLAVTVTITVASTYYLDADGDLYGNAGSSVQACAQPAGYVINNLDCNDVNSAISPTTIWYLDVDADGSYVSTYMSCTSPGANYNMTGGIVGDCNDNNPLIRPGVTETCNSIDDDCDALIDENSSNTY